MEEIVLVHGAWHGAWCWEKLVPHLEERGLTVTAPDLLIDQPFETSVDVVVDVLRERDKVLLLGHSMGGAVISAAAERVPDAIERLIFLAAFAPQDGETINSLVEANLASALRENMALNEDGRLVVREEVIAAAFYGDCDDDTVAAAMSQLRPQHPSAFSTALRLSAENYGRVEQQYIECIEDQAIHISLQRRMARAAGCTLINSIRTSHSPFLSAPAELAGLILQSGPPPT